MWWDNHDNRQELAAHLITIGTLTTPISVLRFFEKPWKYTIDWEAFTSEHVAPDYTCQKCAGKGTVDTDDNVQNAHLYTIRCPDCGALYRYGEYLKYRLTPTTALPRRNGRLAMLRRIYKQETASRGSIVE